MMNKYDLMYLGIPPPYEAYKECYIIIIVLQWGGKKSLVS